MNSPAAGSRSGRGCTVGSRQSIQKAGGSCISFFSVFFGFGTFLIPLMIGARDMAFPRLNALSFWLTAFGGLLLYFSFIGGNGLYGAGNAPDVGWFAYAPLTSRA